jgi:hypothetical protein
MGDVSRLICERRLPTMLRMRVSIEISAALYHEAKALARTGKTTMRDLVDRGLLLAIAERRANPSFRLRDCSVGGDGLHPEVANLTWSEILARSYGVGGQDP